jgi:phage terminase large subunit GpA-like protein
MSDKSPFQGLFRLSITPFLREVLEALDDPLVREVDAQKSAQIGWTDGVLVNWLGYTVAEDPAPTIVLFPADKKGKEFNAEKWDPAVEASPVLAAKLITKSRAKENRQDYKDFPGGFIKFVGSNSPSNVKSTTAKNLAVEEPDDCNLNIKGQGDSITMLEERGKRYRDMKLLVGGTPSIAGASAIESRMKLSDQRRWYVPCHECGEENPLTWEQVKWEKAVGRGHPVYGDDLPETARYACPSCGVLWTNPEKVANVQRGRWKPTGEFRGVAGFYFNELMSVFPGSELKEVTTKYLQARHEMETKGDITKMIVFWNQSLGLAWEFKGKTAGAEELVQRVEDYPEWFVPWGGLVLTVGVDVQHDRLAAVVRAWGDGEESWLVWAGEFYGNVLEQAVWDELDRSVVFRGYRHVSGIELRVSAVSLDTSDGQTADAGYKYCRRANQKFGAARVMPIKGSTNADAEIFRKPTASLDVDAHHKGAKYGLRPYMVGVGRAKDLILGADELAGRVNLRDPDGKTGRGPGRYHWYRGVRADYFDQLTAEVKAPARNARGQMKQKKVWLRKAGKPNEFLDCEVYALHAARALRLDTYTQGAWTALRTKLQQGTLFEQPAVQIEAEIEVAGAVASQATTEVEPAAKPQAPQSNTAVQPVPVQVHRPVLPAGRRVRSSGIER